MVSNVHATAPSARLHYAAWTKIQQMTSLTLLQNTQRKKTKKKTTRKTPTMNKEKTNQRGKGKPLFHQSQSLLNNNNNNNKPHSQQKLSNNKQ